MIGRILGVRRRDRAARDRAEIWALQVRYAGACDRGDMAAIVSCFSPTARCTYNGERLEDGRDGVAKYLQARGALMREAGAPVFAIHLVGNVEVDFEGSRARAQTYGVRYVGRTTPDGFVLETRGLLYDDMVVQHEGAWVVQERELRGLWETTQPAVRPS